MGLFGYGKTFGYMVGRWVPNSSPWGCSGIRVITLVGSYVGPHFRKILYFEVHGGIWKYIYVLRVPSSVSSWWSVTWSCIIINIMMMMVYVLQLSSNVSSRWSFKWYVDHHAYHRGNDLHVTCLIISIVTMVIYLLRLSLSESPRSWCACYVYDHYHHDDDLRVTFILVSITTMIIDVHVDINSIITMMIHVLSLSALTSS
jgi:hypothetical protein